MPITKADIAAKFKEAFFELNSSSWLSEAGIEQLASLIGDALAEAAAGQNVAGLMLKEDYDPGDTGKVSNAAVADELSGTPSAGQVWGRNAQGEQGWIDPPAAEAEFAAIPNNTVLANTTGAPASPTPATASELLALLNLTVASIGGLETALNGKAASSHTHSTSQVTGLDTALSGIAGDITALEAAVAALQATAGGDVAAETVFANITGSSAPLTAVTKAAFLTFLGLGISSISGLQAALDGKAASSHTHSTSQVDGLETRLSTIEAAIGSLEAGGATQLDGLTDVQIAGAGGVAAGADQILLYDAAINAFRNHRRIENITAADFTAGTGGYAARTLKFFSDVTRVGSAALPYTGAGPLLVDAGAKKQEAICLVYINSAVDPLNPFPANAIDEGYEFVPDTLIEVRMRWDGDRLHITSVPVSTYQFYNLDSLLAYWDMSVDHVGGKVQNRGSLGAAFTLAAASAMTLPAYDAANAQMLLDGGDGYVMEGGQAVAAGITRTLVFVVDPTAPPEGPTSILYDDSYDDGGLTLEVNTAGSFLLVRGPVGTNLATSATGAADFSGGYKIVVAEFSGTGASVWVSNGSGAFTQVINYTGGATNTLALNADRILCYNAPTYGFYGNAKAVLVASGALSEADRMLVAKELSRKYQVRF